MVTVSRFAIACLNLRVVLLQPKIHYNVHFSMSPETSKTQSSLIMGTTKFNTPCGPGSVSKALLLSSLLTKTAFLVIFGNLRFIHKFKCFFVVFLKYMNFKMLRWRVASPPPSKKEQLAKNRKAYKCEWVIKDFCPLAWSVSQEAMGVYKKKKLN